MGAMLVGMATGFAAMGISFTLIGFSLVTRTVVALVIRRKARRLNMDSGLWAVSGFILGVLIIPVYLFAKRKTASLVCTACGQQNEHSANFCVSCGAPVSHFDDGRFLKKILLIAVAVIVAVYVISAVFTLVIP
ncbi:MAG: zinc ribbon domain-containing protein [Clostridia bacterium]|nr:zinc ribbon domain-containing protein [Clostridia bacterium]